MSDSSVVLVGAGGHARSVMSVMDAIPVRFVEAGEDDEFLSGYSGEKVIITVGYVGDGNPAKSIRRQVIDLYVNRGVHFGKIIAKNAVVAPTAKIGTGAVVLNRAVVNADAGIGCHSIVNTGAIIEHNVSLCENVSVAPGAIVLGGATIGDNAFIGAGAIVKQGVKIAANAVVGMGAIVTEDIVVPGAYVGNPARRIA